MKKVDIVLVGMGCIGLFMAGVVWRPAFGDMARIKDALESTSYLATTLTALVVIYTLNAWKHQFKHAEQFSSLKLVKDAITDLHLYRGHLLALIRVYRSIRVNQGRPDAKLVDAEVLKKTELLAALSAYKKAWASAVAFFTPEEESSFPGPPNKFLELHIRRPQQIKEASARYPSPTHDAEFEEVFHAYNEEAKKVFLETVEAIESMIRKKALPPRW